MYSDYHAILCHPNVFGGGGSQTTEEGPIYVVQFDGPIDEAEKYELQAMGVELHEYRQLYCYVVEMQPSMRHAVQSLSFVNDVNPYRAEHKVAPKIEAKEGVQILNVYTFKSTEKVGQSIAAMGGTIHEMRNDRITISIDVTAIPSIAQLPYVKTINSGEVEYRLYNADATWILQTNSFGDRSATSHGIVGNGELLTVMDSELRTTHEMFADPECDAVGSNHRKI